MVNKILRLIALWGVLGLGFLWLSRQVEKWENSAIARGRAECEVKWAENYAKQVLEEREVKNVGEKKAAIVWSRPSSRLPILIKRMREQGIGTTAGN